MAKLKSNGSYKITFNDVEYDMKANQSYEIDEETAKQFVESGYCSYAELDNGSNKSKKTNKSER